MSGGLPLGDLLRLPLPAAKPRQIAWGKWVFPTVQSEGDRDAGTLGADPDYRIAVMDFESAGTFSPSVVNMISGAAGLIQFTAPAEQQFGVTQEQLATMSAVEPLDQIEKCVQPSVGSVQTVEDTCVAALGDRRGRRRR